MLSSFNWTFNIKSFVYSFNTQINVEKQKFSMTSINYEKFTKNDRDINDFLFSELKYFSRFFLANSMLISSQIFYKFRFMLIAKSSWSKICISWFNITINIKLISFLRTWLTRIIDALNRINTKNASYLISINTSKIMKKVRTNERQECNNKRRHELRKRYKRKFILFKTMMMMKSRFQNNKHQFKTRLEKNKHRFKQNKSRLLEFKRKRKRRRLLFEKNTTSKKNDSYKKNENDE
jgi:hypothetical protein